MKKLLYLFLALIFAATYSYSQEVKGSGNIIKKDFQISNINKIGNISSANIFITQSESENLSVEIDDNLLQYFDYKNGAGVEIKLNGKSISPTKFNVYVNVKGLKKIENIGSGNVTSTNTIKGTQFKLEQTGSGDVDLNVSATELKVDVTGSGNTAIKSDADFCNTEHMGSGNISLKIDNVKSSMKIEHTGSGNIDVDVKGTNLAFTNTGSGNGTITGTSANFKLENEGSGDVTGKAFTTDYCNVELSGSGDAEFNCNKEASIELNGSGDLKLKGDYKVKNIEMNGSGKLIK
jgi:hypothetical protein